TSRPAAGPARGCSCSWLPESLIWPFYSMPDVNDDLAYDNGRGTRDDGGRAAASGQEAPAVPSADHRPGGIRDFADLPGRVVARCRELERALRGHLAPDRHDFRVGDEPDVRRRPALLDPATGTSGR